MQEQPSETGFTRALYTKRIDNTASTATTTPKNMAMTGRQKLDFFAIAGSSSNGGLSGWWLSRCRNW